MSISSIMNIAKNALFAAQTSMQVTSHNISNVNTKGYARQEAVLDEATPLPTEIGLLGNGVVASRIIRYYDKYLEKQIMSKNMDLEQQGVYQKYFERIEGILNEDNSRLTENIVDFFNGWQELSVDPQSVAVREGIVASGKNLSSSIRNIYTALKNLQIELNSGLKEEVSEINRILSSIASLNGRIFEGGIGGSEANDYIDQRNELLKDLSGKMDVITFEDQYGRATVLTSKGKALVDGERSWQLEVVKNEDTGFWNVAWKDTSGNLTDITDYINGGKLKGLIQMRDEYAVDFIGDVNDLAQGLIENVNNIHTTGVDLYDDDGIYFFRNINADYAKDIDLSDDIKADSKHVSAFSDPATPTDNDIALSIAALIDEKIFDGGNSSAVNYTASLVNKVGQLTKGAEDMAQYNTDTMAILDKQREEVSGVSIDEEMTSLIKFQYAYQAAARLINVADEMFQSILGIVQ